MNSIITLLNIELRKIKNTAIPWVITLAPIVYGFLIYMLFLKGGTKIVAEEDQVWRVFNLRYWMPLLMMFVPIFSAIIISVSQYLETRNNMWKVNYSFPTNPLLQYAVKSIFSLMVLFTIFIIVGLITVPLILLINLTTDLPEFKDLFQNFIQLILPTVLKSFIATIAIWAIHNWVSYRFDNFIVSTSVALVGTVITMVAMQGWEDIVYYPYAFPILILNKAEITSSIMIKSVVYGLIIFALSAIDAMLINKNKA